MCVKENREILWINLKYLDYLLINEILERHTIIEDNAVKFIYIQIWEKRHSRIPSETGILDRSAASALM